MRALLSLAAIVILCLCVVSAGAELQRDRSNSHDPDDMPIRPPVLRRQNAFIGELPRQWSDVDGNPAGRPAYARGWVPQLRRQNAFIGVRPADRRYSRQPRLDDPIEEGSELPVTDTEEASSPSQTQPIN